MRSRILPAMGVSVSALALAFAFAPMANASGHGAGASAKVPASQMGAHQSKASCYAQRDNDAGNASVSQNFESSFDQYDAQAADDFKLKKTCKLKTVNVDGLYFNGSGPADSFDVTIYKGKAKPGKVMKACTGASYTETGFGSPIIKCKAKVSKKAKWVSVVANLNFSSGGEWGWSTNLTVRNQAGKWQNPGGGFATGCDTWTDVATCIPGSGPDFSFSLN